MGDAENVLPASKKRAAGRELSRDNPGLDDEGDPNEDMGTFKRASEEVLANRRIVKVRRNQTSSIPSAPSSNPFASISLVPPTDSSTASLAVATVPVSEKTVTEEAEPQNTANKETEKGKAEGDLQPEGKETEKGKDDGDQLAERKETEKGKGDDNLQLESKVDPAEAVPSAEDKNEGASEVRKPGSSDADTGKAEETANEVEEDAETRGAENDERNNSAGGDVEKNNEAAPVSSFQQLSSTQNAFTGLVGTGFSNSTFSFGSILKTDQPTFPSFGFGTNGNSSMFGTSGALGDKTEGSKIPSMQEVPVETGEENEKAVFTADSVLFEFLDGGWKERGKGELKVNVSTTGTGKARLVMRARGNYRLILNASLFPDMKLTDMEKKGITFACLNSAGEGKDGLSTFALRFKEASVVEDFRSAVTEHKGSAAAPTLKTPENSPKASDE